MDYYGLVETSDSDALTVYPVVHVDLDEYLVL